MAKKIKNGRCPLQGECGRSCSYVNDELGCNYYKNNAAGDRVIPDQEELRARIEAERERLAFEAELAALPDEEEEAAPTSEAKLVYISVDKLEPHPDNPRKDLGDLTELADSIKAKGVMQNLTVVPFKSRTNPKFNGAGRYTVIIGHRRLGAAKLAGLTELPCVITEMSEQEQIATMLLENMQRSDLTVYEQAHAFRQLVVDFGQSVESVAKKTGFSETTVRRRLEIAKLDKKKLKEISERQLSFGDFEELAKIKDIKKRNEVLKYIGTHNFASVVESAVREEAIAEALPFFLEKLAALGAKEMEDNDRWSGKYEQIASLRVTDEGAADKALVPKKYQGEPLFYSVRSYWGDLEIYRKRPKEETVKRPKAEIEREKEIKERNRQLEGLSEVTRNLRAGFVKGLVMHSKNREAVLMGAAQAISAGVYSYQYNINSKTVLEFVGRETSNECGKNDELFAAALSEMPQHVIPALIYLQFENNGNASYGTEVYNGFPEHVACARLDALYAWLCSLGYEMSDEELALQNGTHEVFAKEGKENGEA